LTYSEAFALIFENIWGMLAMALLFGFIVMWLWNWLMPEIFGLTAISFWQAWGLVVLAHILFKSFPHNKNGHHHDDHWKKHFREKFHPHQEQDDSAAEPESHAS
jgi:hypothetical protein